MFKDIPFEDNGGKFKKNLLYARFFFLFGVWTGFTTLLVIFAIATTFFLNNISFINKNSVVYVWDILCIYAITIMTYFLVKLFPVR